uniref:Phospholipase-like protein n=1 Tax=Tanacetum cinerariifolium TaxID=118510 RepID=A0A6L2MKW9_TANCI|nr:phospholipase-like protein [Tanacetum cinerariifolium]
MWCLPVINYILVVESFLLSPVLFGTVSFHLHSSGGSGELKFQNRVFPNKIGFSIKYLDIIGVIEDEEIFGKLSDDDAIRLCLLLALEVIFMGRLLTLNVDDTLFSLVENIKAWNSFPWGEHLWCHLYDEIKNLKERHGDENYYGLFKDLNYVPTYTLTGFEFALKVFSHERSDRPAKLKFTDEFSSMTSDLCDSLNSMFADLIELADPDEDIGQDTSRVLQSIDTVWLSDDIERFLGQQFHIMSGEVTFYDTGHTYDYDYRDWLAHGLSLDVDDHVDVALAYREKMVRFY